MSERWMIWRRKKAFGCASGEVEVIAEETLLWSADTKVNPKLYYTKEAAHEALRFTLKYENKPSLANLMHGYDYGIDICMEDRYV